MTRKRLGLLVVTLVSIVVGNVSYAYTQTPAVREYQVKAAFLYNFAKFVEWPAAVFGNAQSPIILCVVGADPFGEALETLKEMTVKDRRLGIQQLAWAGNLTTCQITFISASEKEHVPQLLEPIKDLPILTISDMESFLQAGGMINLVMMDSKIGFEINLDAARRAGLTVSSQLLKLAIAVKGKP